MEMEIIVGDDASTDDTSQIVKSIADKFPGRIKLFRHANNIGGTNNLKFVIEQAKGDYIAHLDGDDFWLPGKLEMQLRFLENHPECVAVYSNAAVINSEKVLLGVFTNRHPPVQDINYLLRRGNYLPHGSILYHAYLKDEILSIKGEVLDYRIHCNFAARGMLGYLDSALIVYRAGVEGSVQLTQSELVRNAYWGILMDLSKTTPKPEGLRDGIGKFIVQVVITSLLTKNLSYAVKWIKIIRAETSTSYGIVELVFAFLKAMFRKAGKLLQNRALQLIKRDVLRVICVS